MYLKRLDLHGFKSFATATALEFGPGVTCIAGPNGSGKTNVAEAIRWVLGEQASRTIRARKTEDFIFTGSAKRNALGLAEVRITLDNSDKWLPLDFDEVVVSRRANRSGENEYLLNQSRVRLKDLNELFLKAEVGQNSYAFMGQGLVEQVLTLRPEERRGLIEEAADVRLHREKLNASRSRLAATLDNLERAELVIAEIEPRLRQLERQSDRASDHARLSSQLAVAVQALFGQQWQDAQEALAAARAGCDQRQEEFDRANREIETREEGLASLAGAIDERRRDITKRDEAARALEEYRRDLEHRSTVDAERQAMLDARREELVAETESLGEERAQITRLVTQQQQRSRELAEALDAARVPDKDSDELARIDTRLAELRSELERIAEQRAAANTMLAEAQAKTAAFAKQEQRLRADLASFASDRAEQMTLLKTWAGEFATRRARSLELTPKTRRTTRALEETKSRLERASITVVRRQEESRIIGAEIASAEARLEAAQATDADLPAPDAGVQALFAAGGKMPDEQPSPDSRIHGLIGMVGQILRVPAGMERAIEAALADSLHAIVVETQEDALAAIELLVSEDRGRATIYPLSDVRPGHPINLLEERGVIGVASQLVKCEGRFRPLVNALLGRTIVAQNIGVAKGLLRRGLGSVVTLDGALLQPSGAMTAGSAKAVRRAFVRQRDVGELPSELERLRASLKEAEAALEPEQREQTEAQQERDRLAPDLERLRNDLTAAEEALRQHRARLPITAARLKALHARSGDARESLAEAEAVRGAARTDVEQATARKDVLEARQRELQPEIERLTVGREGLARSDSERSSRISALAAEEEALNRQAEFQSAAASRIEGDLERRAELAKRLEDELKTVVKRFESSRQELEVKTREAEVASEELAPARHSLEQLESRQGTLGEDLASGRSTTLTAERALLEAQSAVRLRSDELEALRERLEEEGFRPSPEGEVAPSDAPSQPTAGTPPAWLTSEGAGEPTAERAADDQPPPIRGGAPVDTVTLKERITELRADIRMLGPVNEQAETDYEESKERHEFLTNQVTDLREAEAALQDAIGELEAIIRERFSNTFKQVNASFQRYFQTFFGGGSGELLLTKPDEQGLPGVDVAAQPPRKKVRTLAMLSGGERSLTAMALLFALLETHPSPICVLDEVDAALDDANVDRFTAALRQLAERTQFIIITHNRRTLEIADTIYGVSMGDDSTSTVLSLRLSDVPEN